jgi:hypothetical protein
MDAVGWKFHVKHLGGDFHIRHFASGQKPSDKPPAAYHRLKLRAYPCPPLSFAILTTNHTNPTNHRYSLTPCQTLRRRPPPLRVKHSAAVRHRTVPDIPAASVPDATY